ncbi:restriction endonuclease subunit S [Sporomusa sphaeroides]|uniref:Type-1 restriction enzyme EcoKI specificity protein n=1 Tax=Sporomusa sphaeroides DSM 2875 TaxID=1337886 RepID=A0ABM9W7M1_9FIRM|nr:restriction endonuclease subunit S [Sporomusa sphaeroides]OLS54724.1 type-1 restriction enzyme EcoKI specificity protein [Sporomusa sphaeroides DSM 2875]CVK20888.1 Type-1 restriction enzyme EcoKI specificity protein [Sporomusa sphaeroides DSM 2875]
MAKKKKLSLEELLKQALVKDEDKPYDVPGNWVWTRLGAVMSLQGGGTPSKAVREFWNGSILWASVKDIKDRYLMQTEDSITELGFQNSSTFLAVPGDVILVTRISPGKSSIASVDVAINQDLKVIKKKLPINSLFLWGYFTLMISEIENMASGTTVKGITAEKVHSLPFALPPLAEQQRIVDIIESLFEKLDRAKELAQHALDSFENRKSAILHKAFTGELTRKWREENKIDTLDKIYETIKEQRLIITKNGKDKKDISELFDKWSLEDNLSDNGWIKLKAKMICDTITCGNTPTENISAEGEIPFLKVYNIVNNKIDFDYKSQFINESTHTTKLKSSILQPNDIVMNIVGPPLRKIAIIPNNYPFWNMNQAIVRFRPIDYVDAKYLFYCLINGETLDEVINETKGVVGQANISITQSRNLEIPIPPIQEQQEIVRILDNLLANEQKAKELCNVIDKIDYMKKAILARAFRGELGTNNPDEESALELLKEVLKEKI